jgi:hypothetical protein
MQAVIDKALDDAAAQTGLLREALEVISADRVIWPDGSMGCPKPDVVYTQSTVPGYRVQVKAGESLLSYHANQKGLVFLCPTGGILDPVLPPRR